MDFPTALNFLKARRRVTRRRWGGLSLVQAPAGAFEKLLGAFPASAFDERWHILVVSERSMVVMPWLPSQADLFAEDWMLATGAQEPLEQSAELATR